ncbi:hypothetical protein ACQKWADRAFT_278895 [Trichoderma austrokoningii]
MLMHGIGLGYIGSLLDGAGPAMAGLASHRPIVCYITVVETVPIVSTWLPCCSLLSHDLFLLLLLLLLSPN